MTLGWLITSLVIAHPPASVAVVALQPTPVVWQATRFLEQAHHLAHRPVLPNIEAQQRWQRLHPTPAKIPWARLLRRSRTYEAYFQAQRAHALRQKIISAFQTASKTLPSSELRYAAAQALQDAAASLGIQGHADAAFHMACEIYRLFPAFSPNTLQHGPPTLALFTKAHAYLQSLPKAPLRLQTTAPGQVWIEGQNLGWITSQRTLNIPPGSYRIWIQGSYLRQDFQKVHLTDAGMKVTLHPSAALQLRFQPTLTLPCLKGCPDLLQQVGQALHVTEVWAVVNVSASHIHVLYADVLKKQNRLYSIDKPPTPRPRLWLQPWKTQTHQDTWLSFSLTDAVASALAQHGPWEVVAGPHIQAVLPAGHPPMHTMALTGWIQRDAHTITLRPQAQGLGLGQEASLVDLLAPTQCPQTDWRACLIQLTHQMAKGFVHPHTGWRLPKIPWVYWQALEKALEKLQAPPMENPTSSYAALKQTYALLTRVGPRAPTWVRLWSARALTRMLMGETQQAKEDLTCALTHTAGFDPHLVLALSYYHAMQGHFSATTHLLQQTLTQHPNFGTAWPVLAWSQAQQGNILDSLQTLIKLGWVDSS